MIDGIVKGVLFGLMVGAFSLLLLVLLLFIPLSIKSSNKFRAECHEAGGEVLQFYKGSRLCVSEDGRVIVGVGR